MTRPDEGQVLTGEALSALEKRIQAVFRQAYQDLDGTVGDYFSSFARRDGEQRTLLKEGEITEEHYRQWRLNQIARGRRWVALRDQTAERMTQANETAVAYINDATPGIYTLNRSHAIYEIEKRLGRSVGIPMWDERTVKRLAVERPELMPYYPPARAVRRGIDLAYGKKQITASVTSSILQGGSIKHMAEDLRSRITTMNRDSAIRTARTAVTGAQNGGRMDTYAAAEKMGIRVQKQWLATLDGRTRHTHAALDGERQDNDRPFSNGCMFPGDPHGAPKEVYNCRCTLIASLPDVDTSDALRRDRDTVTGQSELVEDMTYREWAAKRQGKGAGTDGAERPGVPKLAGRLDFSNKKAILRRLAEAEKELAGLAYEVNYSVTSDGNIWRVSGETAAVNPSSIPSSLKGSYSYHNHPAGETWYSFSAEDAAFFISSGEAYSKASDDVYEYVMRRTTETIEMTYDEVYHRFMEIKKTDVRRMEWDGIIDPDMDGFHETMKLLSQEMKFTYEREKKGK